MKWITPTQIRWFILAVVFVTLFVFVFRSCDKTPPISHKPVTVSEQPRLEKEVKQWKDSSNYWKGQAAILREEVRTSDILIDKADTEISRLIKVHRNFKAVRDTVEIVKVCDSLIDANEFLMVEINQYQQDMNALIEMYDTALQASDSAAIKQTQLNSDLRIALDIANTKNAGLVKDYNKELKKKKRERTVSRVLAAAVMVTGGALLLSR